MWIVGSIIKNHRYHVFWAFGCEHDASADLTGAWFLESRHGRSSDEAGRYRLQGFSPTYRLQMLGDDLFCFKFLAIGPLQSTQQDKCQCHEAADFGILHVFICSSRPENSDKSNIIIAALCNFPALIFSVSRLPYILATCFTHRLIRLLRERS